MATILITDDEPLIVRVLATALRAKGHRVATAESGFQALQVARKHKPDLVISDVKMPGMDGFELVEGLRTEIPHAKFILMSGGTDFDDARVRERSKALQLAGTFKKPFSVDHFFAAIAHAIGHQNAPARLYSGASAKEPRSSTVRLKSLTRSGSRLAPQDPPGRRRLQR